MSNWELKAEVSRLQSQLNSIERENAELRSEIGSAVNSVNQAEMELSNYNQHIRESLDNATGSINNSINKAISAYELQGQIDQLYTRYKCVELANKKIRSLNNKKYYDFKSFRVIRKIVQGMMDNLDLNMVSDHIIYKSVEREHLLTPDYWLTSALISIMAWRSDDKALAERALESAFKLDKKNTSIFFMIFNLRMDRNDAAVKWFLEYQKCELKGSDENTFLMMFSLISKTLTDNVDDETSRMISDYIHNLILDCANKEGYSEEDVVGFIRRKMEVLCKNKSYDFQALSSYCSDYSNITRMLNLAYNNYNILEFILRIVNVPVAERNTYLKEYLNELLSKPNDVELGTYNEIEYNELIISMGGDVEGAKEKFSKEIEHRNSDFNIISTMIGWVYDFGNEDVNGQMRLNMFTLLKTLQDKAASSYFDSYRSLYSNRHAVNILDYSTDIDFTDEGKENAKVEEYYNGLEKGELSTVKDFGAFIAFGLGVACGVAAFFVHFLLLIGLVAGLITGATILISNNFKRKNVRLKFSSKKSNVIEIIGKLFKEFDRMKELYQEYDAVSVKVTDEIAKL